MYIGKSKANATFKKIIYSLICEVKGNHIGCSFSSRQGRKGGKRTNSMNRTKLPTC